MEKSQQGESIER